MGIYHHNLSPFLFRFGTGNFGLRWYSLAYISAFIWIYLVLAKAVRRKRIPNADDERLEEACLYLIGSIIVGGRLGYFILNQPHTLLTLQGWLEVPQLWHGGMAFYGAAFALFYVMNWYCKTRQIGFWHGADKIMWVFAFALGFGRLANFINGELYGIPTDGTWGVIFPVEPQDLIHGVNVPRHPIQLYAALSHFLLGFYLLWVLKRKPRTEFDRVPGFTMFHFFCGYGLWRFVTDFWRHETIFFGALNGGQVLSLVFFGIGLLTAHWRYRVVKAKGTALDWYPPEGNDGELPDGSFAELERVYTERAAAEAAKPQRGRKK